MTINDSLNVSSIVDNGVGDYTIVWKTPFANANYTISGTVGHLPAGTDLHGINIHTLTPSNARITVQRTETNQIADRAIISVTAVGR